jgi:nicotinamide-nucleotide amidase
MSIASRIDRAEIIAVGSELTCGSKLDTNSQWLSIELAGIGVPVASHTVVADELDAMVSLFREAAVRSDLVVISGGLGPTLDDLTRQALADAAGVPLVRHEPSLARIRELFESRGRVMPERNVIQAMFPEGAMPIHNPRGTAPGVWFESAQPGGRVCRFVALPGVPSELRPMFRESVLPRLPAGERVIRHFRINAFGAGESAVEEKLGDVTARGREPEVGITAHEATITLRITAVGPTVEQCEQQVAETRALIRERLGDLVFGEEEEQLQDIVVRRLRERGETLAIVETPLSGGCMTEWLTAVPDVDDVLRGGLTAVSLDIGLDQNHATATPHLEENSPARMLAEAYRTAFRATWGVAIVGTRAAEGQAGIGTIAVVGPDCVTTVPYRSFGDPAIDRSRAAKTGLDLLRRWLNRT